MEVVSRFLRPNESSPKEVYRFQYMVLPEVAIKGGDDDFYRKRTQNHTSIRYMLLVRGDYGRYPLQDRAQKFVDNMDSLRLHTCFCTNCRGYAPLESYLVPSMSAAAYGTEIGLRRKQSTSGERVSAQPGVKCVKWKPSCAGGAPQDARKTSKLMPARAV